MPVTARRVLPLTRPAPPAPAPRPPHEPGRPWTVNEAAAYFGVSPQLVGRLVKAGKLARLDPEYFGRRVLIADASVRALAEGKPTPTAPDCAPPGSAG